MAASPRDFDNPSRHGSGLVVAVIVLALVALLLSAFATAGRAQEIGDSRAGLAYAQKMCAECHAVLASQTASPNPRATAFKVVANTPGMTGTAIAVWLRTPHPTMPNLIIAGDDIENLVSYILELRDKK